MITDNETNFLYLSDQLCQRQSFFNDLTGILFKRGINFGMLPHTKDIWSVDYMPVQKSLKECAWLLAQPTPHSLLIIPSVSGMQETGQS